MCSSAFMRVLWLALISGCGIWIDAQDVASRRDRDLDGVVQGEDCDDNDPNLAFLQDWFVDGDQDGAGGGDPVQSCGPVSGRVPIDGDCNDADPTVFPGAPEYCDGIDNDCNSLVDDDPVYFPWFEDGDGDTWGDDATEFEVCVPQPTGADRGGDCDDTNPGIHPEAIEVCSGLDEDCDGKIDQDDDDMQGDATWYPDGDGDGYGDGAGVSGCEPPATGTWALVDGDCNDADPDENPGSPELCDGRDNNCNNLVDVNDPSLADGDLYYPDTDGDGFGASTGQVVACSQPPSHVLDGTDCDDSDGAVHPKISEVDRPGVTECGDGDDNDCDGAIDALDSDCHDDDVDGVVNGIDAIHAFDIDTNGLQEHLCVVARLVSDEPWRSEDAVPVARDGGLFPVGSLDLADTVTLGAVIPGEWCWDLRTVAPGNYDAELVSVLSDDGSSPVTPGQCNTWYLEDTAGYCQETSDSFCAVGLLIDNCSLGGQVVAVDWDGSSL